MDNSNNNKGLFAPLTTSTSTMAESSRDSGSIFGQFNPTQPQPRQTIPPSLGRTQQRTTLPNTGGIANNLFGQPPTPRKPSQQQQQRGPPSGGGLFGAVSNNASYNNNTTNPISMTTQPISYQENDNELLQDGEEDGGQQGQRFDPATTERFNQIIQKLRQENKTLFIKGIPVQNNNPDYLTQLFGNSYGAIEKVECQPDRKCASITFKERVSHIDSKERS